MEPVTACEFFLATKVICFINLWAFHVATRRKILIRELVICVSCVFVLLGMYLFRSDLTFSRSFIPAVCCSLINWSFISEWAG
ncbi:hypothetical protein Hdeb2414_s0008g00274051 [Helianthus debilis subsp. tardiflorus]